MMCQARVGGNMPLPKEENTDNDMCHIDEDDIMLSEVKLYSSLMHGNFNITSNCFLFAHGLTIASVP